MELILVKDVKGLGKIGQVVRVSDGQARNQLLPTGVAVPASADALRRLKEKQEALARHIKQAHVGSEHLARRLAGYRLTMKEPATSSGNLYAAVTARRLSEALRQADIDVPETAILLPKPIKAVGTQRVALRLAAGITATVTVIVEPTS